MKSEAVLMFRLRSPATATVLFEYADTGLVRRFPTAILCMGMVGIAILCVATGLILDLVAHVRRESKRLAYLQYPAPRATRRSA